MITTKPPKGEQAYTVLRAICMGGQRVEPGALVTLTAVLAAELAGAGKVSAQPADALESGEQVEQGLGVQTRARKPRSAEA